MAFTQTEPQGFESLGFLIYIGDMIPKSELTPILRDLLQEREQAIFIFQNNFSHHIHYLVTNLRIINCTNQRDIKSYYHAFIYKIEIGYEIYKGQILLHTQPMLNPVIRKEDLSHIILLKHILNPRESKKIIEEAWFEESPFGRRKRHFEKLAKKHGLYFTPIVLNGNSVIQITGKVQDMDVLFYINHVYRFRRMYMSIACPNPENNHLSIEREKASDAIRKLFGKQDIITHSEAFDKRFLLQSDHQKFFDFVVTEEIRNQLMDVSHFIDGSIYFGLKKEKEKSKKANQNTEFDILDEHLLDELLPEVELDDTLFSPLVFQCEDLRKDLSNVDIMIAHSIDTFELMLKMAFLIKEYSKREIKK